VHKKLKMVVELGCIDVLVLVEKLVWAEGLLLDEELVLLLEVEGA
jgi:hypothetical protein